MFQPKEIYSHIIEKLPSLKDTHALVVGTIVDGALCEVDTRAQDLVLKKKSRRTVEISGLSLKAEVLGTWDEEGLSETADRVTAILYKNENRPDDTHTYVEIEWHDLDDKLVVKKLLVRDAAGVFAVESLQGINFLELRVPKSLVIEKKGRIPFRIPKNQITADWEYALTQETRQRVSDILAQLTVACEVVDELFTNGKGDYWFSPIGLVHLFAEELDTSSR